MNRHLSRDETLWLAEMIEPAAHVDLTDADKAALDELKPRILAAVAEIEQERRPWWRRWFG